MFRLLAASTTFTIVALATVTAVSSVTPASAVAVPPATQPATTVPTATAPAAPTTIAVTITPAQPRVSLTPEVDVIDASADQVTRVADALDRFGTAGLLLPDLEIIFSVDLDACNGHDGLFSVRYSPWRITVCSEPEYVVTHELAHAWEAATMTDEDRLAYVAERGLETWDASDAAWGDRGVEDVAIMIQQNLMARGADASSERWQERIAAYELLTGATSPVLSLDR